MKNYLIGLSIALAGSAIIGIFLSPPVSYILVAVWGTGVGLLTPKDKNHD